MKNLKRKYSLRFLDKKLKRLHTFRHVSSRFISNLSQSSEYESESEDEKVEFRPVFVPK